MEEGSIPSGAIPEMKAIQMSLHPLTPSQVNTLFPWELWLDGQSHEATYGRDFPQEIEAFISMLRRKADKTLTAVSTMVRGEVVSFQFYVPRHSLRKRASRRVRG